MYTLLPFGLIAIRVAAGPDGTAAVDLAVSEPSAATSYWRIVPSRARSST
jgi:hypothetical protein